MKIGEFLVFRRTQLGLSQKKLASLSGIHIVQINRYEKNVSTPSKSNLEKLAPILNIPEYALSDDCCYFNKELLRFEIGDIISSDVPVKQIIALREIAAIILADINSVCINKVKAQK